MSVSMERYEKYKEDDFDATILRIKSGVIKAGRFAHLVKVDPKVKMKGKVFFDESRSSRKSSGKQEQ